MAVKKTQPKAKAKLPEQAPARKPSVEAHATGRNHCPVVGFGASAGGLEAFTELLQHVPKEPGIALVFIQHLDPKHASILTELLARATTLPVMQAADGMHVEANHVYVIPPSRILKISKGLLRLEPREAGLSMPIDSFFRSLAEDLGNRAIGVILSGTASDGTLGLMAIKAEGGITFAQDVQSAKYDGMPRSAIAAGCVDFILPPEQIAREIMALCHHPYVSSAAATAAPEEEPSFKEVFSMLRSATGVDFSYYKPGTIRRRTLRRMALQKIGRMDDYVAYLKENRDELRLLFEDILINVTGFFRESATYEFIKARVLPVLFKDRSQDEPVRVWVPGCSSGEEVYSIAISLIEYMRDNGIELQLQIFGTDLSDSALEKARAGIYPDTIASEVSTERLRRFFVPVNGSYQIARSVRDACVFARQNVTKDPPFSKLDLIICRNVLIYLGPVLQNTVLRLFHYALRSTGFLVLGHSETVGNASDYFTRVDKQVKIYSRKAAPSAVLAKDLGAYEGLPGQRDQPIQAVERSSPADIQRKVDQLILARYSPSGIVIDSNLRILQFRGAIPPFLTHTAGDATLDLNKMAPVGLCLEIRKLVQKAQRKVGGASSGLVPVTAEGHVQHLRISAVPVRSHADRTSDYLVIFEESPAPSRQAPAKTSSTPTASGATIRELEKELATTKEYLQTVIEEQEAGTEELKSAHEEVQSANEELQSTNEELLTAKEELQSTNEELTTVNEEMQGRNAELQQVNNDVLNLLSSVNIPIIMLGNDLRIRRFTPQAERILNLLPTDMGRPVNDLRLKINVPDLSALCENVIDDLTACQREVQDADGRTYAMWIRPYRTAENRIDGVVIAMFDLTERRQSAEARYRRLFEAAPDGIVIADARSGEILDVNPFVIRLFGYPKGSLVGQRFWDSPLFAGTAINQNIPSRLQETETVQMAVLLQTGSGTAIETEILGSVYEEGGSQVIQFNISDLTAKRNQEEQRRRAGLESEQNRKMEAIGRLAGGVSHDFNNLLMAILGFCDLLRGEMGENPRAQELLSEMRVTGERALLVTRQLLAFDRKQVVKAETLDLNHVVAEMNQLLRVTLPDNVELVLAPAENPCLVRADLRQLEQAILNLVINARDAMPSGGRISVSTAAMEVDAAFSARHPAIPLGDYATLTVKDTGVGMDSETQSRMFEPFFTTKPKGMGSGLGLATVHSYVHDTGGYIWAYSELGVGTTVTIYLPRVADGAHVADEAAAATQDQRGTETVMVVEDEPAVRGMVRLQLEQRGYNVLEAANGREALQVANAHHHPIDLMVTDVVMPQMSGRELAFQLASSRPDMKVLYMSGHTADAISQHGVLDDGLPFLEKPFTPVQLAAKIRQVLGDGN